jgi:uncharacterized protein YkwD
MNIRRTGMACVIGAAAALLAGCGKDWRSAFGLKPAAATTQPASRPASEETAELGEAESAVVKAINWERWWRARPQLRVRADLVALAREHSRHMMESKELTHLGSDGATLDQRAQRAGVPYGFIGQIITRNSGFDRPGKQAVKAWMSVKPQREALLRRGYRDIGVGVSRCPETGAYFVTAIFRDPEKP